MSRTYKDQSSDPSVSFQTPTHVSPDMAAGAVAGHEQEHVRHEQAKAESSGRKVIFQSVTIQSSICPECGRSYVSGGKTTTITGEDRSSRPEPGEKGSLLDLIA
jgi:hypothetical protein